MKKLQIAAYVAAVMLCGQIARAAGSGWLGVSAERMTQDLAKAYNLGETYGALVRAVTSGSPAAQAGVQPGDIILDVNGQGIANDKDLQFKISGMVPGRAIKVTVFRLGTIHDFTLTLGEMPPGR